MSFFSDITELVEPAASSSAFMPAASAGAAAAGDFLSNGSPPNSMSGSGGGGPNTNYLVKIQGNVIQGGQTTAIVVEAPMPESISLGQSATYEAPIPQGLAAKGEIGAIAGALGVKLAVQAFSAKFWTGTSDMTIDMDLQFHTETDPIADVMLPVINLLKLVTPTIGPMGLMLSPGPSLDLSKAGTLVNDVWNQAKGAFNTASDALFGNNNSGNGNSSSNDGSSSSSGSGSDSGSSGGNAGWFGNMLNNLGNAAQNLIKPNQALFNSSTQTTDGRTQPQSSASDAGLGTAAQWKQYIKNPVSVRLGNYLYFDCVLVTSVTPTFASNFDALTGLPHSVGCRVEFTPMFSIATSDIEQMFLGVYNSSSNQSAGSSLGSAISSIGQALGF